MSAASALVRALASHAQDDIKRAKLQAHRVHASCPEPCRFIASPARCGIDEQALDDQIGEALWIRTPAAAALKERNR